MVANVSWPPLGEITGGLKALAKELKCPVIAVLKDTCQEPGIAEILIGKQRNGPTGTVKTVFRSGPPGRCLAVDPPAIRVHSQPQIPAACRVDVAAGAA